MIEFNPENQKKLAEYLSRYPTKQAAILPVLWMAQEQFGHLSREVMAYVASLLEISPIHVFTVATFYTMFNLKPVGRHHVQVCRTLSCALAGGEKLLDHVKSRYQFGENGVTADGKFSVCGVECLASCGTAPAIMINEAYYENLSTEKLDQILDGLK